MASEGPTTDRLDDGSGAGDSALERPGAPIRFEDYAFVTAGSSDGIPLADLLAHRGLDHDTWRSGEAFWDERVLAEADVMDGLLEKLTEHQMLARQQWARAIPPLDDDLRTWIHFQRRLAQESNPLAYLDAIGLRPTDLATLASHWQQRLQEDRQLLEQVAEWSVEPLMIIDIPRPQPPRLHDAMDHTYGDLDETLPTSIENDASALAPLDEVPSLSMPLPAPEQAIEHDPLDDTASVDPSVDGSPALPFSQIPPPPGATPSRPPPADGALPFKDPFED